MPRRLRSECSRAPNLARMSAAGIGLHHALYVSFGVSTTGEVTDLRIQSAPIPHRDTMKIYRGNDHVLTHDKPPSRYAFGWKPGEEISLEGTKDKSGRKHTRLELVIEEQDVIALFIAFLKASPNRLFELLAQELGKCDRENERLRDGLRKIQRTADEKLKDQIKQILNPNLYARLRAK